MAVAAMIMTSALWALTFVAPLLAPDLAPTAIAGLRYAAFGLVSAALLLYGNPEKPSDARVTPRRRAGRGADHVEERAPAPESRGFRRWDLRRGGWGRAALHALTGNIGHYLLAVLAVRVVGAPVTVSIIALVPIAYGILGGREEAVGWRQLAGPLALTAAGIVAIDVATLQSAVAPTPARLLSGVALAAASGGAWLWYGLDTARYLRETGTSAGRWTSKVGVASGIMSVPLLMAGFAVGGAVPVVPAVVIALVLGVGSSWLGTAGFNLASARLPRHLVAPLMALEPAWTLVFAHVIDGRLPSPLQATGEVLLLGGAVIAMWTLRSRERTPPRRPRSRHDHATPHLGTARGVA